MTDKLKCYKGGSRDPFEYEFISACFAHNRNEAKRLMWKETNLAEECQDEWHLARVVRDKNGDQYASESTEPYIVRNDEVLRKLGFMYEGDELCDSCGRAEMHGRFPVCSGCMQCIECGCDCEAKDDYVKGEEASGCSCGCGAPSEIHCYDLPEG